MKFIVAIRTWQGYRPARVRVIGEVEADVYTERERAIGLARALGWPTEQWRADDAHPLTRGGYEILSYPAPCPDCLADQKKETP